MRRTIEQNRRFHMYLNLVNFTDADKKSLVKKHTGNRTDESHEMQIEEMHRAIGEIKNIREQWLRMHLYVIGVLCAQLRWTRLDADGRSGIDWPSLNGFIKSKYHKETIHKLTNEEINKLVVALRAIANDRKIKADKERAS